jgi:hypothetical protein
MPSKSSCSCMPLKHMSDLGCRSLDLGPPAHQESVDEFRPDFRPQCSSSNLNHHIAPRHMGHQGDKISKSRSKRKLLGQKQEQRLKRAPRRHRSLSGDLLRWRRGGGAAGGRAGEEAAWGPLESPREATREARESTREARNSCRMEYLCHYLIPTNP